MSNEQQKPKTEDNLSVVDVLTDFNEQLQTEETSAEGSNDKGNVVAESETKPNETKRQTEDRQETVEYLIDNKFKDTPDGKKALAKAYKELQSTNDRTKSEHMELQSKSKKLMALDNYLKKNPQVVKQLKTSITNDQKNATGPPPKPENYDIMDEAIDNSDAAKWRESHNQWLVDAGRKAASEEINKFKQEKAQEVLVKRDNQELTDLGLNDTDKVEFQNFMKDSQNMSNENLVRVWKLLSGKQEVPISESNADTEPLLIKKEQQTSAAAVSGNVPASKAPKTKELEDFWNGIMGTSNRVYTKTK